MRWNGQIATLSIATIFIATISIAAIFMTSGTANASAASPPIVHVSAGDIRGVEFEDGSALFRGVPFAAPPTAANRWRAPQPLQPWTGVRDATHRASPCMQASFGWNEQDARNSREDCLYLDVHTPKADSAARLPVMVWIHGGANRAGSAGDYAISNLIKGGIVLVAIQYRLDVFGFLSVPELTRESGTHSSGNYALLDQLAALRWVKDNISAFGGDPNQVTIAGQSAGAQNAGILMLSPLSRGLFTRVIEQSGTAGFGLPPRTLQENEALGAELMKRIGAVNLSELRSTPARKLLEASVKLDAPNIADDSFIWLQSVIDGYVLPDTPEHILAAAKQQPVSLLLGTNATEFQLYGGSANVRHAIATAFADHASEAEKLYGLTSAPTSESLSTRIAADIMFRCPASFVATAQHRAGHRVWQYEFGVTSADGKQAQHGSELPFVFEGRTLPQNAKVKLQDFWASFVKAGNPNPNAQVQWPEFGNAGRYIEFTDTGLVAKQQLGGVVCNYRSAP